MNYRIHEWGNIGTGKPSFGIQRQDSPGKRFKNVSATLQGVHRALIYTERSRCEEVLAALKEGRVYGTDLEVGLEPLRNPNEERATWSVDIDVPFTDSQIIGLAKLFGYQGTNLLNAVGYLGERGVTCINF